MKLDQKKQYGVKRKRKGISVVQRLKSLNWVTVVLTVLVLAQLWLVFGSKAYSTGVRQHGHSDPVVNNRLLQHEQILNSMFEVLNKINPSVTATYLKKKPEAEVKPDAVPGQGTPSPNQAWPPQEQMQQLPPDDGHNH